LSGLRRLGNGTETAPNPLRRNAARSSTA
jgi:hypothetical protein